MKFVYDKRTGQMIPENLLNRVDATPLEKEIFEWLDNNPRIVKQNSFSTRFIAYEFLRSHYVDPSVSLDTIRDAIAKWYNQNHTIVDNADEGIGGCTAGPAGGSALGGNTAGVPQNSTISSISSPQLPKKKEQEADEAVKESKQLGTCYKDAWNAFYNHISEKPLLCHGIVTGQGSIQGVKYNHAWIEIGDLVIDTTIPAFANGIDKEVYYRLGNVDQELLFKYNSKQIAEKATDWKTYGPWEDILWQYP